MVTYLSLGHTITGGNLDKNISMKKRGQLNIKHGNPGQVEYKPLSDLYVVNTYYFTKLRSGNNSWDGGKITEKARARNNSLDMLNSVCLNKVVTNPSGWGNKIQDLYRARFMSTSSLLTRKEEVEIKQRELVQLAELKGIRDPDVYAKQLLLARSRLFREYAVELISKKPGSQTPGIDKESYEKNEEGTFEEYVEYLRKMTYHSNQYEARAIKRVWIPKPGKDEKRPLGIPTVKDRTLQALVNLVLLPLVEMTSDPNSYGFRPNRDCKMAIAAARTQLKTMDVEKARRSLKRRYNKKEAMGTHFKSNQEKWILDADIKGFFDNISHAWLLENLCLHPDLKKFVKQWLNAKIFDQGTYTDPYSGTPQGGIISPTLANFTLNGLEQVVNESIYPLTKSKEQRMPIKLKDGRTRRVSIATVCIRYADDFIVITRSKNILDKYIQPAIDIFLKERGLWLNPQKTKQIQLKKTNTQLDFLGYTFKFAKKWSPRRSMLWTKKTMGAIALYPNKDRMRSFIREIKKIIHKSQNKSAVELISQLNPKIRGWANYFNLENSSRYRDVLRQALYHSIWSWMRKKHPTLGKRALAKMYLLRADPQIDLESVTEDSPIMTNATKDGYLKMKNVKWVFYGLTRTKSRFSKKENRTSFLLNPTQCATVLAATKYLLPENLRTCHAFDDPVKVGKIIKIKLDVALMSSPKTPTLKEQLFKKQEGLCFLCKEIMDPEYLHFNSIHIHHINPIKKGGNKYSIKNLALTHIWCHRSHKH
jgi:retron-type reverse transcriptase